MRIKGVITIAAATLLCISSSGQFYNTGRGRTGERFLQYNTNDYRLVFPRGYEIPASRFAFILDTIHPHLNYGIDFPIRKVPIILRTENIQSNGYVTWAPKREELVMSPSMDNYALTWSKGLAVHEGRHVAQISAMKRGLSKVASWVLGEAGISLALLVISSWQMEGDAVLAETQFAEFGRGLQPDFTIGYRGIFADRGYKMKRIDPLVCGSYKSFYPDIYHYGYQIMSAADYYYSPQLWGEILKYSAKWPIFVLPDYFYLKSRHNTSYREIAQRTFGELDSLWKPYSRVDQNYELLTPQNRHSYTNYQYPIKAANDILAVKTDFDNPAKIMNIESGKSIVPVGNITSRPILGGDKLYWTEYRPHPIFEQVSYSSIRSLDLKSGKKRNILPFGRNFMVTPIDSVGFAAVSMDELSNHFIRFFDADFNNTDTYRFGRGYEIALQGLTWDSATKSLCYIALDKHGMYIGKLAKDSTCRWRSSQVTAPSVVTVSDLTSAAGKLYFSSIQSGKNEIHTIDLISGNEHRLTDSRFGAIAPNVSDSTLLFTSYTGGGYMVAGGSADTTGRPQVKWSRLPENILNPVRNVWDVPKVDSIDGTLPAAEMAAKPFDKVGNGFSLHSWAPIGFDGDYLFDQRDIQLTFGASAFFQSTLGELTGYATYGWLNNRNWLKGRVDYTGLPLTISLRAEYGGGDQVIYGQQSAFGYPTPKRDLYFSTTLALSLPLNFSSNGYSRLLQPSFAVQYSNSLLWKDNHYVPGFVRYEAGLWYSSTRYTAHRSVTPSLGYAVKASVSGAFEDQFAAIYSLYGRGYLPGFMKNHSLTLEAGLQYQQGKTYLSAAKTLLPRAVVDPYAAKMFAAVNAAYAFPVFYPDWGFDGVIFFKRITLAPFGGYSVGQYFAIEDQTVQRYTYSYGVDLGIDFNIFRAFEQNLQFTFAFPSTSSGMFFGVAYNFGF